MFKREKRIDISMKNIKLFYKLIIPDKSEILLDYKPDENWRKYFTPMGGEWEQKDGWLIGTERGNKGGILFTNDYYEDNVMLSFTAATVLPATRDINAVFCAHWNDETDYLGEAYVSGINGWYEEKSGLERHRSTNLKALTTLYKYTPGTEVRFCVGAVDGHCFMTADDILISELIDPNPIKGGHVGFSPYCTRLRIKDIQVRKIYYEPLIQSYDLEFDD